MTPRPCPQPASPDPKARSERKTETASTPSVFLLLLTPALPHSSLPPFPSPHDSLRVILRILSRPLRIGNIRLSWLPCYGIPAFSVCW